MKPIITRFDKNSGDILLSIPMFDKDIFHRIQQIEKCNPSWFDAEHYNIFDLIKENQELKKQLEDANEKIILLQASGPMLEWKKALEKTQQKEFIEWLEAMSKIYENEYKDIDIADHYNCVLTKYKEIIGE